ncbi:MAG: recombinase family protein [Roseburia intestinalis]
MEPESGEKHVAVCIPVIKAVLNDETEWIRLENHHTAIIDRALFEKANEMHPKKKKVLRNHAPILLWKGVKNSRHY